MRLIDAEELYKQTAAWEEWASENVEMLNKQERVIESLKWDAILSERSSFKREVMDAPTIDAVPVIRCKDCKHYVKPFKGYPDYVFCKRVKYVGIRPDFFCADGKRKDETEC